MNPKEDKYKETLHPIKLLKISYKDKTLKVAKGQKKKVIYK